MWKECIKGYEISSSGEVRNSITKNILKQDRNSRGYKRITIRRKHYLMHRLMATVFIPNPKDLPEVIFKTPDKENIKASNLQWIESGNSSPQQSVKCRKFKNRKITSGMIYAIRFNKKMSAKDYAKICKCSVSTIYSIRKENS